MAQHEIDTPKSTSKITAKHVRVFSIVTFIVMFVVSLFMGVLDVTPSLLMKMDGAAWHAFVYSRIPRVMAVVITGISLSVAGLIMQKIAQNRFVSPSTAVTMDAARLGIIISLIVFAGMGFVGRSVFALVFAVIGTLVFMKLVNRITFKNIVFVPLMGMMMGMVVDSITTYLAMRFDLMQTLAGYMLGSFTFVMQGNYELLYLSIPLLVLAYVYISRFSIVAMGSDFARNVGVNYERTLLLGILMVSLLSASVVVTIGSVPFVGLMIPNIVTKVYGDGNQSVLIDTALLGGNLLLICDLISRVVIYPYEVPIGLILGVVGSIFFLVVLLRSRHEA
ncbi:iron chelate uptake ABC transporter family permease subunit [Erysipelothrix sp. HDW6C]|uniref:ABC transporter permease n=1 Tax=Erysipelothrix sp. HDW6C TaxID=2714930 RepID=UPI0014086CED|nr:iron chelate uptake ABC transporter family permease subunit [Erysipelothrix sp. HDW6C]QIK70478.1 iron chelate uptake ABC transporter family permease subunit [Erysipelothrix sp. HDW6C]